MSNETKSHVIDGKTFVEVERKAKVGEKVVVVENELLLGEDHYGNIYTATKIDGDLVDTDGRWNDGSALNLDQHEYRVLEPVDQAPTSTDDLIANLVRRVASLEQAQERLSALERGFESFRSQLRDTQRNVERQGVEIGEVQYLAKAAYDEITEHTAPTPCEDAPKVSTSEPQVFDLAKIKSFKLSDLAGKTLRIHSATDIAEGISVTTTVAIDAADGKMYVLESGGERR